MAKEDGLPGGGGGEKQGHSLCLPISLALLPRSREATPPYKYRDNTVDGLSFYSLSENKPPSSERTVRGLAQ